MKFDTSKTNIANNVNFELLTNVLICGYHPLSDNNRYNQTGYRTLLFSVPKDKNDIMKNDIYYEQFIDSDNYKPKSLVRPVMFQEDYFPSTITQMVRGHLNENFCNPSFEAEKVLGNSEYALNYLQGLDLNSISFDNPKTVAKDLSAFNQQFIANMATNEDYCKMVVKNIKYFNSINASIKEFNPFKEGLNNVSSYIESCYKAFVNQNTTARIKSHSTEGGRAKA